MGAFDHAFVRFIPYSIHRQVGIAPSLLDGSAAGSRGPLFRRLDGEFWERAPQLGDFVTFIPDFDVIPKEQTEVRLAYDPENIYFEFRCYHDIASIKASVSPRDKMMADDYIAVNLDAFNDQQGLTVFYVNPLGIQGDSRLGIGQYNDYENRLTTDLLASFTYIPGTALYLGYGSVFEKV